MPSPARVTATISELAPGGDGVALCELGGERRAVFVRGAAPGDELSLEVDTSKRPARGRVVELLRAGDARVTPACPHASRCGGCDWMHVALAAQAEAHRHQLASALPAAWMGRVTVESRPAPASLGYRARARLHARVSGGRAIVGMNEVGTHEPVEVDACVVLAPALEEARRALPALLEGAHGRGDVQIAMGQAAPVLELRWVGSLAAPVYARLEQAVAGGQWAGVRVWEGEASRPAVVGDPTPWMRGVDGAPLRLAPGGFGQASEEGNAALVRAVAELAERAGSREGRRIVELYAGAGNLTIALAPIAADLVAVEASRDACDAARANLADRGLRARVVEADAASYAIPSAARLVVLDPPRTGARAVMDRLAASKPRHILYVSCDPQTLARDLAVLATLYEARAALTFEMFPQTSHVESVVLLERAR